MKRSRGLRTKSRKKLRKGRFSIAEALQEFKAGERVQVNLNPAVHRGMPHPKYQGYMGKIREKRGRSFVVDIHDGGLAKQLVAKPEHLKPVKVGK